MTVSFALTVATSTILHFLGKIVFSCFISLVVLISLIGISHASRFFITGDPWWLNDNLFVSCWTKLIDVLQWLVLVLGIIALVTAVIFLTLVLFPALGQ